MPQEYFSDASRAVRIRTALAKNVDPSAVDVEMAAAAFALDENSRDRLRRFFIKKFLSSDAARLDGARYNPHGLIDCDKDLADYFCWLARVAPGGPPPPEADAVAGVPGEGRT